MKKIQQWIISWNLKNIGESFVLVAKQYPIALAFLTVFVTLGMFLVHVQQLRGGYYQSYVSTNQFSEIGLLFDFLSDSVGKAMLVLVPTFFISLAITRYRTANGASQKDLKNYAFQLLPIIFFFVVYSYIEFLGIGVNTVAFTTLLLSYLASIAMLFLASEKNTKVEKENKSIYENIHLIVFNGVFSLVIFIILLAFGHILLFSLEKLFNIVFSSYIADNYIFVVLYVVVVHFLTFPLKLSEHTSLKKIYHFFITKLFFPFFILYFTVLYAYTAKVLWNFSQWPEGIISYLVILFSFFGIVVFVVAGQIQEQRNKVAEKIAKYFPYLLLPQVAMLAYAIYLRISEYGLTLSRYMVVALGIYLCIFSLYFILKKEKRLRFIFTSFLGVLVMVVFIPKLSFIDLPQNMMMYQVKQLLFDTKISSTQPTSMWWANEQYPYTANFTAPTDKKIKEVIQNEKKQSTEIFTQYKKITTLTDALAKDYGYEALQKIYPAQHLQSGNRWGMGNSVIRWLNLNEIRYALSFSDQQKRILPNNGREYFSFTSADRGGFEIGGFSKLLYFNQKYPREIVGMSPFPVVDPLIVEKIEGSAEYMQQNTQAYFSKETGMIIIENNIENQEQGNKKIALSEIFNTQQLKEKISENRSQEWAGAQCIDRENIKICVQSLYGYEENGSVDISSASGYILLK